MLKETIASMKNKNQAVHGTERQLHKSDMVVDFEDLCNGMVLECIDTLAHFQKGHFYMLKTHEYLDECSDSLTATFVDLADDKEVVYYIFTTALFNRFFKVIDARPYSERLAIDILDVFEDMLDEKGIFIPDEDRTGAEGEACLYGETYHKLQEIVASILEDITDGSK